MEYPNRHLRSMENEHKQADSGGKQLPGRKVHRSGHPFFFFFFFYRLLHLSYGPAILLSLEKWELSVRGWILSPRNSCVTVLILSSSKCWLLGVRVFRGVTRYSGVLWMGLYPPWHVPIRQGDQDTDPIHGREAVWRHGKDGHLQAKGEASEEIHLADDLILDF